MRAPRKPKRGQRDRSTPDQTAPDRKPCKAVPLHVGKTEEETERNLAALLTSPDLAAHRVVSSAEAKSGLGELIDVPHLMAELRRQAEAVSRGDMTTPEAMLMNQATALQSLFARLAERGMSCDTVPSFESNMRMALRAQRQCRSTLETLAMLKNPPVVIAKQANVTTGPQQINNSVPGPPRVPVEPNAIAQLEEKDGKRLDARATRQAIGSDSTMATLEAVDWPEDDHR